MPESLWQAFNSAIITSPAGSPWEPSSLPCFIVSACCPFSQPFVAARDQALHSSMERLLEGLAGAYEEVVGQSADGQWKEPSWAIYGITEGQALDLGRLYQQWAVFRWDENGRVVLAC
jgi:hypothetical protein